MYYTNAREQIKRSTHTLMDKKIKTLCTLDTIFFIHSPTIGCLVVKGLNFIQHSLKLEVMHYDIQTLAQIELTCVS